MSTPVKKVPIHLQVSKLSGVQFHKLCIQKGNVFFSLFGIHSVLPIDINSF